MTALVICWYSMFGYCVYGEHHVFPSHYNCVIAKRLYIDKWIDECVKEPEDFTCKYFNN